MSDLRLWLDPCRSTESFLEEDTFPDDGLDAGLLSPPPLDEDGREPFDLADKGRDSSLRLPSRSSLAELGREDLVEFEADLFADSGRVVATLGDFIETCESSEFERGSSSGDFDLSKSTVRAEVGLDDLGAEAGLA